MDAVLDRPQTVTNYRCPRCNFRALLAGDEAQRFATLFDLQFRHARCEAR